MPRPKSKKRMYFDENVQNAIIEYQSTDSVSLKNKIYQEKIHYAFDKLCENIINTFKFTYFDDPFEDVKNEVVSFLVMNMHKWDHTKGSKAFSYFSIVAKNYLILHNNNNYKRYKSHTNIKSLDKSMRHGEEETHEELIKSIIRYFEENIPKIFKKEKDRDIAYSIIELFKQKEEIENFNKKSLYILVREMTNVETVHITKVVNVLKKHYRKVSKEYFKSGDIHNLLEEKSKFF